MFEAEIPFRRECVRATAIEVAMSSVRAMEIEGAWWWVYLRKTWWDCVTGNVESFGLTHEGAQDRDCWSKHVTTGAAAPQNLCFTPLHHRKI